MQEVLQQKEEKGSGDTLDDLFIVLCASGFEDPARLRSALMFASLAAAANYRTILYCIQNGVEVMVKGAVEKNDNPGQPGPAIKQRLDEAMEFGVEIQCCTQTMANKNIIPGDLLPGVTPSGAMSLIELASHAKGSLCF